MIVKWDSILKPLVASTLVKFLPHLILICWNITTLGKYNKDCGWRPNYAFQIQTEAEILVGRIHEGSQFH